MEVDEQYTQKISKTYQEMINAIEKNEVGKGFWEKGRECNYKQGDQGCSH